MGPLNIIIPSPFADTNVLDPLFTGIFEDYLTYKKNLEQKKVNANVQVTKSRKG